MTAMLLFLLASGTSAQSSQPSSKGTLPQPLATNVAPTNPFAPTPLFVYPSRQDVPYTTIQLRPRTSGNYGVWIERAESSRPEINPLYDKSDIVGINFTTGQRIIVSDAAGVQTEPDISGAIVVWQDMSRTCATCEADILGKNLETGETFTVAAGPDADGIVDHAHPAIAGKNVAWLELNKTSNSLKVKNLDSGAVKTIATTPRSSGISFNPPAMSNEYIIWSEVPPLSKSNEGSDIAQLRAYKISDGSITTITKNAALNGGYAIADRRVVWSAFNLNLVDLSTNATTILYNGATMTPYISGDTVVWSMTNPNTENLDVWGLDLRNLKPLSLVTDTGNKRNPVVAGDKLLWQNDGGEGNGQVTNTSVAAAFASAATRPEQLNKQQEKQPSTGIRPEYNTYKGMWTAIDSSYNGWGYNSSQNQAINALGADINSPRFGSVAVLNSEMNYSTWGPSGGYAAWGPRVANAMRLYQETYGLKVVFRLDPTTSIEPGGGDSPDTVVQKVLQFAGWRNWLRHIEVESEPNLEWPYSCTGCTWAGGGMYTWNGWRDYRKYGAINTFYIQVWYSLLYYQNNCSYQPNNNCQYLRAYTYWSPSMDPDFTPLTDGQPLFGDLTGMVNLYNYDAGTGRQGGLSYNVYPNPGGDSVGGHLPNKSWSGFNGDQQNRISNGTLRSQITEFGWTPGAMDYCYYGQDDTWLVRRSYPNDPTREENCKTRDQQNHRFENDLNYFLTSGERHNAISVSVWMLRGWSDKADGIDSNGNRRQWLSDYMNSNP